MFGGVNEGLAWVVLGLLVATACLTAGVACPVTCVLTASVMEGSSFDGLGSGAAFRLDGPPAVASNLALRRFRCLARGWG